jgi:hypothetical protein
MQLAKRNEVDELDRAIQAALEDISPDDGPPVEVPEGESINIQDWREGVEDLAHLSEEHLWGQLGLEDKRLPFFQEWTDPNALVQPWTDEGERWLGAEQNPRELLRPRWHQLVGILRMLQRVFQAQPVMVMDGVGIGKTMQAVGLASCLSYYRQYYARHNRFPGMFGEHRPSVLPGPCANSLLANLQFQGRSGNIPDLPILFACPVNLQDQWTREIHRFLRRSTFDILPYVGKLSSRTNWWSTVYDASHQPPHRRILLVTHKVRHPEPFMYPT